MRTALNEEAADRDGHRSLVVAFAGFSFAGILGLVALPGDLSDRALPIWYMLISFIAYLGALNLQDYKSYRWHDHVGDALIETATLGLLLSIMSFILNSGLSLTFKIGSSILTFLVWLIDFCIRIRFNYRYLSNIRR
jgi:hypothetical protein